MNSVINFPKIQMSFRQFTIKLQTQSTQIISTRFKSLPNPKTPMNNRISVTSTATTSRARNSRPLSVTALTKNKNFSAPPDFPQAEPHFQELRRRKRTRIMLMSLMISKMFHLPRCAPLFRSFHFAFFFLGSTSSLLAFFSCPNPGPRE